MLPLPSTPPPLPEAPHRWGRTFAILGMVGIGLYSCTNWVGNGFNKMLGFTTADTNSLRHLSPDPSKPKFRYTLKTNVVESAFCPQGLAFCTYDRLEGEKDTIKLPRSITYEFPTLLVNGVEKDGSGIYLSLWPKSFDPAFFGGYPPDNLMVLDEKRQPTQERWKDRQIRNIRDDKMVSITLRSFYYAASSRGFRQLSQFPVTTSCDVEDRGNNVFIFRHKQGYNPILRRTPEMEKFTCSNGLIGVSPESLDAFILIPLENNNIETIIRCGRIEQLCHSTFIFENWIISYSLDRASDYNLVETHRHVTKFIKSSIIDRSYAIPAEGVR
jgi:hypothetical protein